MSGDRAREFYEALLAAKNSGDPNAMRALLREDIEFHTPRFFKPAHGVDHVMAILTGIQVLLPDFRWTRQWFGEGDVVLEFEGHVNGGNMLAHGIEVFEFDDQGRMAKATVWLRPTSAHEELGAAEDALIKSMMQAETP